MFLLSGSFTPFESMPVFLQDIMYVAPSTHFVKFAQSVLYRGAGIDVVWVDLAIRRRSGRGTAFTYEFARAFRRVLDHPKANGSRGAFVLQIDERHATRVHLNVIASAGGAVVLDGAIESQREIALSGNCWIAEGDPCSAGGGSATKRKRMKTDELCPMG